MKEGLTLEEMAAEITRQSRMKEDYLVDTRSLQMEPYDSQVYLHMFDGNTEPVEPMQVNTIAHRQIGTHLKIPAPIMTGCSRKSRNFWPQMSMPGSSIPHPNGCCAPWAAPQGLS